MSKIKHRNLIVIVDAYSSGALLAKYLREEQVELIHIQSSEFLTEPFLKTYRGQDFAFEFMYTGCNQTLLTFLHQYSIDQCLPGTETGIILSDWICQQLHLPAHELKLSSARRNKYQMIEQLQQFKVPSARHQRVDQFDNNCKWSGDFPVILKPTDGAGSDGVTLCQDQSQLDKSLEAIKDSKSLLGHHFTDFVIEEFLVGEEFIVDMTHSSSGSLVNHFAKSVKKWINGRPVYDYIQLEDEQMPQAQQIISYLHKALKVLGLQHGASHSEVIYTQDGPKLVETTGRLSGANLPKFYHEISTSGCLNSLVQLALNEPFPMENHHKTHMMTVFLICERAGQLKTDPVLSDLGSFRSNARLIFDITRGEKIQKTQDLFSSPGQVVFQSANKDDLLHDWEILRTNEDKFFDNMLHSRG